MTKRSIKLIIVALVAVIVCFLSLSSVSDSDYEKLQAFFSVIKFESDFGKTVPMSLYNFNNLNETEKKAYISVFNNIRKHPEYIKIPELTNDEFRNVYFAVKNDNPDILCFPDACDMISFYNSSFIRLAYKADAAQCDDMMDMLQQRIEDISDLCTFSSDFDKELFFHDYIAEYCSYNENAEHGSDAYGCLVENEAYCSGYSRAMMLLLVRNGIDCILVSGNASTGNDEMQSHMWNIVTIDNEQYFLDVTWDDHSESGNAASHIYFNVTSDEISRTHIDMSVEIECNATAANYFVREKLLFPELENSALEAISNKLTENINSGVFSIEFKTVDIAAYDAVYKKLFEEGASDSALYKIINSVSHEARDTIDVSHINTVTDRAHKYIRLMFDKK